MKKGDQLGQDAGEAVDSAAPAADPQANPTAAKAGADDAKKANPKKTVDPNTDKDAYPDPAYESGGPKGLEPTRYGDWERKGTISDF